MKLLYKLLLAKLSRMQFAGFVLANIIGSAIILVGVRAYIDFSATFKDPEGAIANNHIVIAPNVSEISTVVQGLGLKKGPASFSDKEIKEIESLPGVESIGRFRSSNFKVNGFFEIGGSEWSTVMFVESIPDEFLDLDLDSWTASLDDGNVPIVLPKAYLNVLNYAFVASRPEIPQLGEGIISRVPLSIQFKGNGLTKVFKARVVGFTDRINTILVPDDFLAAASEVYAPKDKKQATTRLIIRPNGKDDNGLLTYLKEHHYTFDGGQDSFKIVTLVKGIAMVAVIIGLLVSILAFFLLVVSIHLLIEKNKEKNSSLIALGYTRSEVCKPYIVSAIILNIISLAAALIINVLYYPSLQGILTSYNPEFKGTGFGLALGLAAFMLLMFSLLHILMIRKEVKK